MSNRDTCRHDPGDLVHEAYRMEGLGVEDCRTIFFDWAIGLDAGIDLAEAARALHAELAPAHPDHPMTALLAEAALGAEPGGRRGGRQRGRRENIRGRRQP